MKSKVAPHCTCSGGTKHRHDYKLEETEYIIKDGLELCRYCEHIVVWVRPEDCATFITKGKNQFAYYKQDYTVRKYIKEEQNDRSNRCR